MPRAYPYGIYDFGRNTGFVNVGTDQDTGAFAVASILGWWRAEGRRLYPTAKQLLITADGGGSNGYRLRQWKLRRLPCPTPPTVVDPCRTADEEQEQHRPRNGARRRGPANDGFTPSNVAHSSPAAAPLSRTANEA